jgi:hypothetical protein
MRSRTVIGPDVLVWGQLLQQGPGLAGLRELAPHGELDPADLETHARIAENAPHLPKPTAASVGPAGTQA